MELARDSVRVLWGLRSVGIFLECSHPSGPTTVGRLGRILSLSLSLSLSFLQVLKTRVLVTHSLQLALLEVAWHLCCLRRMVSFLLCPSISMVQVASRKVCYLFLIIESRASWSVKYKFEDIINT